MLFGHGADNPAPAPDQPAGAYVAASTSQSSTPIKMLLTQYAGSKEFGGDIVWTGTLVTIAAGAVIGTALGVVRMGAAKAGVAPEVIDNFMPTFLPQTPWGGLWEGAKWGVLGGGGFIAGDFLFGGMAKSIDVRKQKLLRAWDKYVPVPAGFIGALGGVGLSAFFLSAGGIPIIKGFEALGHFTVENGSKYYQLWRGKEKHGLNNLEQGSQVTKFASTEREITVTAPNGTKYDLTGAPVPPDTRIVLAGEKPSPRAAALAPAVV